MRPVYRSVDDRNVFPLALRDLRREFSQSTKHALVEFIRERTSLRPSHYQMLGRRSVVKAVWQADRILADHHPTNELFALGDPGQPAGGMG